MVTFKLQFKPRNKITSETLVGASSVAAAVEEFGVPETRMRSAACPIRVILIRSGF